MTQNKSVPTVLLPYQQKWIADDSQVKIAEKSRRIGITWAEAADAVLIAAATKKSDGQDVWYIGYNKDMATEFIETCATWAEDFGKAAEKVEETVVADGDKDILAYRIRFASGHKITALSSRPSNLRGKQGVVVIDEAAFHDNLPELLKAAFALTIWGGKIRIISTHDGVSNYFNEIIDKTRKGKTGYGLHRITFQDALNDGLYKRIALVKKLPDTKEAQDAWVAEIEKIYAENIDEELNCIPKSSGGSYLSYALINSCAEKGIPVVRLEKPDSFSLQHKDVREAEIDRWLVDKILPLLGELNSKERHAFGEDFARSGDLSVFWPLAIQKNTKRKTPFVLEMRNIPHEQQKQIVFYIVDRLPNLTAGIMDAGGNGSYLAEVVAQRYGACITELKFTQGWYLENMPKYKAAFEDTEIIIPLDDDIVTDHQQIKVVDGVAKIPAARTGEKNKKRHGDSAIAGALAYIASIEEHVEITFEVSGNERISTNMWGY